MKSVFGLLALFVLSGPALSDDITVRVTDSAGEPVAHAVVSLPGELPAQPQDVVYEMAQDHLQFDPFVLVVPRGAEVVFPNRDRVRHHVYSFARGNAFELELYGREQERTVVFDADGNVPIGCNIHDDMIAFIRVVDTPHAAVTNADGIAVISATAGPVTVWHPYANAADNQVVLEAPVGGAELAVTLDLHGQR
ncbi:hypothetical protein [Maricaulis parjimensis]|uniref:hypothetical protein n=1 Tax=Maricaulis parjimensis TaxID=144023 RepID=UPI00193AC9EC|nr:hypothetical protein [Maricaulis parjimensis]